MLTSDTISCRRLPSWDLSTRCHDRWPRWSPRSSPKHGCGFASRCNTRVLWIVGSTDRHLIQLFHPGINARFRRHRLLPGGRYARHRDPCQSGHLVVQSRPKPRRFAVGHAAAAPVVVAACRYTSRRAIGAHTTGAFLLASATATTFRGLRKNRARNHSVINLLLGFLAALITEVAPVTSKTRKRSLPARLIPPIRCFPPVECSVGVRPAQAARCRPDSNAAGRRGIDLDRRVSAVTGPTLEPHTG